MPDWTYETAAHTLRRAGFGASRKTVLRAVRRGRERTVRSLTGYRPTRAAFRKRGDQGALTRWWLARMTGGRTPLEEKLTLFWHGHFATAISKVEDPRLMALQNATFRRHAKGRFRNMVVAVARDPAMTYWLDSHTNVKGSPNENFARELMELFTLGIRDRDGNANYSEEDVRELARCLTGWSVDDGPVFAFFPEDHDTEPKTVLGVELPARPAEQGEQDALDVIERIVTSRACAEFLVTKLWTYFAYPDPEREVVDALAAIYLANDTALEPVLRALLLRDEFLSDRAFEERVSPPVDHVVATLRQLGCRIVHDSLQFRLADMGQELFNPPNVAGWPGGLDWTTSVRRFHRMAFDHDVASGRVRASQFRFSPRGLLSGLPRHAGSRDVVDRVLETLGVRATETTRQTLVTYLEAQADDTTRPFDAADDELVDVKLRGLVGVVLTLPEAQLS